MTMNRRRLILAFGAALLVGGWGATQYAAQQQKIYGRTSQYVTIATADASGQKWVPGESYGQSIYIGGIVGMAVGAGLIGFAILRPTTRE